jgi:hypothetical protein
MPTKTRLIDDGNFVHSPEVPAQPTFLEYLDYADRLLGEWREVSDACNKCSFSDELGEQKKELDRTVAGFVDSFRTHYTIRTVRQDPTFWPVSRFLAQEQHLQAPFSILHCNLEMPLHTVHAFRDDGDLASLHAALTKEVPLPWWRSGPHGRPCYLFGDCVWELKESEAGQSDEGLVLLFLEMTDRYRQQHEQIAGARPSPLAMAADESFIPEAVRLAVWRRSRGKCDKCGAREGLDFDVARTVRRGSTVTAAQVQLLCSDCLAQSHV